MKTDEELQTATSEIKRLRYNSSVCKTGELFPFYFNYYGVCNQNYHHSNNLHKRHHSSHRKSDKSSTSFLLCRYQEVAACASIR